MAMEAYEWYNEQQEGLGDLFLDELENYYNRLEELPLVYSKIKKNFRQTLHKFPYVIVFEIIKKEVVIYSIVHTSRTPTKKFKKKNFLKLQSHPSLKEEYPRPGNHTFGNPWRQLIFGNGIRWRKTQDQYACFILHRC